MKIVSINSVFYGSTGKIMNDISQLCIMNGDEHYVFSGFCKKRIKANNYIVIGSKFSKFLNIILSFLTGYELSFSYFATKKLIRKIILIHPDIIHLHNLHSNYLNVGLLFSFIKKYDIPVIWTLHDCWAFTGHCPHFIYEKCFKWETGCCNCPKYQLYPASLFDNSRKMWKYKNKVFNSLNSLQLVVPSYWLYGMVKKSFLREHQVHIINNGINLDVFKPTSSSFRNDYHILDKKIILGVSYIWSEQKGIRDFISLANIIEKDYVIVLVGTDSEVEKMLPDNVIPVRRTQNQTELAAIYSSANVFFNPTHEEVLGLVNIESLACGTAVVTYNTGGSPECVSSKTGFVVEDNTPTTAYKYIKKIVEENVINPVDCIKQAKKFDLKDRYSDYLKLYRKIVN